MYRICSPSPSLFPLLSHELITLKETFVQWQTCEDVLYTLCIRTVCGYAGYTRIKIQCDDQSSWCCSCLHVWWGNSRNSWTRRLALTSEEAGHRLWAGVWPNLSALAMLYMLSQISNVILSSFNVVPHFNDVNMALHITLLHEWPILMYECDAKTN